jgi:hypothetical protein
MNSKKAFLGSAIVLYFIIGLEILIMISPFAGFFYSVFNPFLLEIAKYPATRWLSAFFLPHMVVPPDIFLKFVRVMGSVLFVAGMAAFFVCAGQVYWNKFLKKGTQPAGGRILCYFEQKGIKHGIEKPGERAYHDQYLEADDEIEHNGAAENGFLAVHMKPPVSDNIYPVCNRRALLKALDGGCQARGGLVAGALRKSL